MAVNKYKTKKGPRYQAVLCLHGQRVATKSGFKTKKDARKWLHQEEKRWELFGEKTKTSMDFEELAGDYLTWVEDRRSRNTYIYKRSTFRRFLDFYPRRLPLNELSRELLEEFHRVQNQERGPKAANSDLREIGTMFNWAIKRDYMAKNVARQVEPYPVEATVRYVPPSEDIAAVRMAATPEERLIFDTLYYSAGRLTEILELTWEDINFEANALRLWTSKRRGGNKEPRVIAMHRELEKVLEEAWKRRDTASPYVFTNPHTGSHYTRHSDPIRLLFSRLCKKAGLKKPFTAHAIRHHVASRFADSRKATHRQIQQFLGHMNIKTTETYLHELQVDHDILDAFDSKTDTTKEAEK